MSYLGRRPADAALTSDDISDNTVTSAKIVNDSIVNADIKSDAAIVATKIANTAVTLSDDQTLTGNIRGTITTNTANAAIDLTSTSNTNNYIVTFNTGNPASIAFITSSDTVGQSGNISFTNSGATSFQAGSNCKISAADLTTLATQGTYWMTYFCASTSHVLVTISAKLY